MLHEFPSLLRTSVSSKLSVRIFIVVVVIEVRLKYTFVTENIHCVFI